MIAMVLVAFSMTALVASFTASSRLGTLTRRQANAVAIGKKWTATLATAPWNDARLANNNTGNDASFMDPQSLFAREDLPTGSDAPDWPASGTTQTEIDPSGERYEIYVNVSPFGNGKDFAVIVRYQVGAVRARAVIQGFKLDLATIGARGLPL
jgi:hypothetical protein